MEKCRLQMNNSALGFKRRNVALQMNEEVLGKARREPKVDYKLPHVFSLFSELFIVHFNR